MMHHFRMFIISILSHLPVTSLICAVQYSSPSACSATVLMPNSTRRSTSLTCLRKQDLRCATSAASLLNADVCCTTSMTRFQNLVERSLPPLAPLTGSSCWSPLLAPFIAPLIAHFRVSPAGRLPCYSGCLSFVGPFLLVSRSSSTSRSFLPVRSPGPT